MESTNALAGAPVNSKHQCKEKRPKVNSRAVQGCAAQSEQCKSVQQRPRAFWRESVRREELTSAHLYSRQRPQQRQQSPFAPEFGPLRHLQEKHQKLQTPNVHQGSQLDPPELQSWPQEEPNTWNHWCNFVSSSDNTHKNYKDTSTHQLLIE